MNYPVLSPVRHNGKRYDSGVIQLTESEALPLIAVGALGPAQPIPSGETGGEQGGSSSPPSEDSVGAANTDKGQAPPPASSDPPELINLNTATREALIALPGVGEKTADRLIAARPLADQAAIVAAIGPSLKRAALERLLALVTV
jgi:DNA uptake protein ComE-like DNA-binding protein